MGTPAWIVPKGLAARLSSAGKLGPFTLGPSRTVGVFDRYLDSADRQLWRRGLLVRLRRHGEGDVGHGVLTVLRRQAHGWEVLADFALRSSFSWHGVSRQLSPSAAALLQPAMAQWVDPWLTLVRPAVRRSVASGERPVGEIVVEHAWQADIRGRPVRSVAVDFSPRATPLERQALQGLLDRQEAWPLAGDLPAEALLTLAVGGAAPSFGFWRRLGLANGTLVLPERQGVSGKVGHAEGLGIADVAGILRGRLKSARQAYLADPEDPESLHDLRVVIRRLRSLLARTASPPAAAARKALGSLADITNPARDADVTLDLAFDLADGDPLRADLSPLLSALYDRRRQAHDAVRDALGGKSWRRADGAVRTFLQAPAPAGEVPAGPAEHALEVLKPLHDAVGAIPVRGAPADRLHQLRLAVKRLRYAVESGTLALPSAAVAEAAATLADAQTALGRQHDLTLLGRAAGLFMERLSVATRVADPTARPALECTALPALETLSARTAAEDERLRLALEQALPHIQSAAFLKDFFYNKTS